MRALIQRVSSASVAVDGETVGAIDEGLLILVCAMTGDEPAQAEKLASKISKLRIFRDDEGRMNRAILDTGGAALVVSQFTLAGDCRKGNRPSFVHAAAPPVGERLYEHVCARLRDTHGLPVGTGVFGAMMQVELVNDGPVTLVVRSAG